LWYFSNFKGRAKGIRASAVGPGVIPMLAYHASLGVTEGQQDDYIQSVIPAIRLDRTRVTDEIAETVAFLASDESSYITGSGVFVDGGQGRIDMIMR
jgi:NAD(P)-dependent dehydrogenase (short-subunit alcohol dehydrogenase family)